MAQRKTVKTNEITKASTVWKIVLAGAGAIACLVVARSIMV